METRENVLISFLTTAGALSKLAPTGFRLRMSMMTLDSTLDDIDDDDEAHENGDDRDEAEDDEDERIPWAECKVAGVENCGGCLVYLIDWDGGILEADQEEGRIVDQYEAARRRQADAQALAERRWK